MQPITLHRLLQGQRVDGHGASRSLRRSPQAPAVTWWVIRTLQLLFFVTSIALFGSALLKSGAGLPVDWVPILVGVVGGVAANVFIRNVMGMAAVVGLGVAFALAGGLIGGAAFGVGLGVPLTLAGVGAILGLAVGLALLVALGAAFEVAVGVSSTTAGATADVAGGVATAAALGTAVLLSLFRLPLWFAESLLATVAHQIHRRTNRSTLSAHPVLYHELSYIPFPFLKAHILSEATLNPQLVRRVLEACSIAPGQSRIGREAEAELRSRELSDLARTNDLAAFTELRGSWLPGIQGADPLLLSFSEAGRYLRAAQTAFNPHHRLDHLKGLSDKLQAIETQLRYERNALTRPFESTLQVLRNVADKLRTEAEAQAAGTIANPFRPDRSLSPEEAPELFRGREDSILQIEEILAGADQAASLLLLAPRRTGKSSLLKMLPALLPDTVFVFFDLQAHPVSSAAAFWQKLAEQALGQAKRDRRVELPSLPEGPPLEAAAAWLEALDSLPGGRRILLCIDEFERLQDLFPGSRLEFLQTMGLFRATIQHRRKVRLLVSGAAPFHELDAVWDDHFISARQIRLAFLDRNTAVELLTRPTRTFPPATIPEEVAIEVYDGTGGQPYLLQIFGYQLVKRLNDQKATTATIADVAAVQPSVLEWAGSYFADTFRSAPADVQNILLNLSEYRPVHLTPNQRRWLDHRNLLTTNDRLAVPLFGTWIQTRAPIQAGR